MLRNPLNKAGAVAPVTREVLAVVSTDPGCIRESNQDCGRFIKPTDPGQLSSKGVLVIVADGMGGHSAGEVASALAVDIIARTYYANEGTPIEALKTAFITANAEIFETSGSEARLGGMGTTCTALVVCEDSATMAHVGDSRLYLLREGELYMMSEDHSAVMEMVKHGIITIEQARHHEDKNVIIRALGTTADVEVSVWEKPLSVRDDDQFIICSDGLYDMVDDAEIKRSVLTAVDSHSACESLIELAKKKGGHDNITVGILTIKPAGYMETKRPRETREIEVAL